MASSHQHRHPPLPSSALSFFCLRRLYYHSVTTQPHPNRTLLTNMTNSQHCNGQHQLADDAQVGYEAAVLYASPLMMVIFE